jgi:DNA-binding transcriptional regulator YiaG
VSTGLKCRRSLYVSRAEWHRVRVNELRQLRRQADLSQRDCAGLLDVPLNTFRMWDSGLRPVPLGVLPRARALVLAHARGAELLSLDQLAQELGVHQRTLRAAARTGRLEVTFSVRSVFGRPIRLATRAAGQAFIRNHYRDFGRPRRIVAPLPTIPPDYRAHLKRLRRHLRLTQAELAHRIGAANKAVIYQWEAGKRRPSPVFWQRVAGLERRRT